MLSHSTAARARRRAVALGVFLALPVLSVTSLPAFADDAAANVYATIKPPEEQEAVAETDPDTQEASTDVAAPAQAPSSAPSPAAAAGLSNTYAVIKPAQEIDESLPDVDVTGAIPRSLGGFRAQIEAGAIWVRASAPTRCLPGNLTGVVAEVADRFGEVRIMSTHRSSAHNRRAGGAPRSMHLSCRAIDFRVAGRGREVMAFLRDHPSVGGLKMYRSGLIHIDNGERRSW